MTRKEQLQQVALEINMALHTYPTLLDRLVAVGEWADENPVQPNEYSVVKSMLLNTKEALSQAYDDKFNLEAKLAIAVEALEFYAGMSNRGVEEIINPDGVMVFGSRARLALRNIKLES